MPYKDKEKQRDYVRKWAKNNKERMRFLKSRWLEKHPEYKPIKTVRVPRTREDYNKYHREYRLKNKEKYKARAMVFVKIRNGTIVKMPCIVCGSTAEAHHLDYSKPLEIVWLCKKHHTLQHIS